MAVRSEKEFVKLCDLLRNADCYALLRNSDVALNLSNGGDADLLVDNFQSFTQSLLKIMGPPSIMIHRAYVDSIFWSWGHVDMLPALEWRGARYLPNQMLWQMIRRNNYGFLEVDLVHQGVICWFSSLIWGGFFKERYKEEILNAVRSHQNDFQNALEYAVGAYLAQCLIELANNGRLEDSVVFVPSLRRALWWRAFWRSPSITLTGWLRFWRAELELRLRPPVVWISLLGLDGSGKSSVLKKLATRLGHGRSFAGVHIEHWRPGRIAKNNSTNPIVAPHKKNPRGLLASLAKLGFLVADWLIGYWFSLIHLRAKGFLLAFDRHYVDLLVDPRRYRYGAPLWVARLVGALIPKPDLFILLDLPAEVARSRKPEVPLDEARRLRKRYLNLAQSLPNARVVNADRPLTEVVVDVEEIILSELQKRTTARMCKAGLL